MYLHPLLDLILEEGAHDVHDVLHKTRQAQEVHCLRVRGVGFLEDRHCLLADGGAEVGSVSQFRAGRVLDNDNSAHLSLDFQV